ncbi:MAG: PSD1 and planctomycete cytochrome C domain-containing protein [Pirellulaceae bacterium]
MRTLVILLLVSQFCSADERTFEADVRPILKAHCFHCHGEEGDPEGALDLRLRKLIVKGGESGPAIDLENPLGSLILARIESGEMPPEDKQLSNVEIDIIRQWVTSGAKTVGTEPASVTDDYFTKSERSFWAFQPISRPPVPSITGANVASAIDNFVLARLNEQQLTLSPAATKSVLIRRIYFDLLGMPPTPEAVDAFVNDDSPMAYEQLIDRLLASPRYGERWGRHWLDVAGYADSEGYIDSDPVRKWSFRYRDYVIKSLNQDLPFDDFIIEQLAGDELIPAPYENLSKEELHLLSATGFLRMAPDGTAAGGIDQEVAKNETIADTINIVTTSLMGMTVGCARCHNHRYDPISQKDYYRLRAVFAPALDWKSWLVPNSRRISLYTPEDITKRAQLEAEAKTAEADRQAVIDKHIARTLYEELFKIEETLREDLKIAFETAAADRNQEQTDLLTKHPNIQNISGGSLYLYSRKRATRADELLTIASSLESSQIQVLQAELIAKLPESEKTVAEAALATKKDERTEEQSKFLDDHPELLITNETLGKTDPVTAAKVADIRAAAEVCRKIDSKKEMDDLQKIIDDIRGKIPVEGFVRALTEPANHTPETFLFRRGDHRSPGETAIPPGDLSVLGITSPVEIPSNDPAIQTTGRRLNYARHLTSDSHPLLARVMVNRIWYHHFGNGFVNTTGDFGFLGERPSHPQLLDWLSREFIESGWQIKRLHKLIVTSETYKQQSVRNGQLDEIDPDNRLFARQSIRRIESEVLRDVVLSATGKVSGKMFGEPVPVMEDAVGQIVLGEEDLDGERKPRAADSLGEEEYRRSIYVQVRRSRPLGVLETFDIATVAPNCTKRATSNVAPQSLLLMNSDFMVKYSGEFAQRLVSEFPDDLNGQLTRAWRIAFSEVPTAEIVDNLYQFHSEQIQVIRTDEPELNDNDAHERVLAIICQAILGSNQFIYID